MTQNTILSALTARKSVRVFTDEAVTAEERAAKVKGWNKAVKCAYGWAKDE